MTYEGLADFVANHMRMSHVYQPVMLFARCSRGVADPTGGVRNVIPSKGIYR